tara:strand:- start:554 stop:1123 length:570 start_codon:yes stop_codon:yes gene_type:complete
MPFKMKPGKHNQDFNSSPFKVSADQTININNAKAKIRSKRRGFLDWAQDGLTAAGMIPGVGAIPDLLNTVVSAGRAGYAGITGDKEGTKEHLINLGLNLAAAVPVAGQAAGATKLARSANKIQKGVKSIVPDLAEVSVKAGKAQKYGVKGVKGTKSGVDQANQNFQDSLMEGDFADTYQPGENETNKIA